MFLKKDNQFSMQCHARSAEDCDQHGGFCDSEEEATEWVEDECWIFSGDFWICHNCNMHYMRNLVNVRRDKAQEKIDDKPRDEGPDPDLEELVEGIEVP